MHAVETENQDVNARTEDNCARRSRKLMDLDDFEEALWGDDREKEPERRFAGRSELAGGRGFGVLLSPF